MKILFYGNCQTEVVMSAIAANNPKLQFEYAGNSNRVAKFDPERTRRLMDWCDHIVTQPVMNLENPDHHTVLRARFANKITFMPYIWIDGLFSICGLPEIKASLREKSFVGQSYVSAHLQQVGFTQTLHDFQSGELDFQHRHRFESSMEELSRREAFADVKVTPFVREHYRDRAVMLTHNHPHPVVINEIARQISARLDLCHAQVGPQNHAAYSEITLPQFGTVFSPFVVTDLDLHFDYDLQWLRLGQEMIAEIADQMEGLADRPSRKVLSNLVVERRGLVDGRKVQNAEMQGLIAEKQSQTEALRLGNETHRAQIAERNTLLADIREQNAERHAANLERQRLIETMKIQVAEKQRLIAERHAAKHRPEAQVAASRAQTEQSKVQEPSSKPSDV